MPHITKGLGSREGQWPLAIEKASTPNVIVPLLYKGQWHHLRSSSHLHTPDGFQNHCGMCPRHCLKSWWSLLASMSSLSNQLTFTHLVLELLPLLPLFPVRPLLLLLLLLPPLPLRPPLPPPLRPPPPPPPRRLTRSNNDEESAERVASRVAGGMLSAVTRVMRKRASAVATDIIFITDEIG